MLLVLARAGEDVRITVLVVASDYCTTYRTRTVVSYEYTYLTYTVIVLVPYGTFCNGIVVTYRQERRGLQYCSATVQES